MLAFAYGKPVISGKIKNQPEDFIVDEMLSFAPTGEGEHLFLNITKRDMTTHDLTLLLSKQFSVSIKDIGYAGMKDKRAVTSQWLSVPIMHCDDYPERLATFSGAVVNKSVLHNKKLKRGVIQENKFTITITNLSGSYQELSERLDVIKAQGIPNYFTEQRFGVDDKNVLRAELLLNGKMREKNIRKRGIYFSAARSFLFNLLLSERITITKDNYDWLSALHGDVLMLNVNHSVFVAETLDSEISQRLQNNELDVALPMFGTDGLQTLSTARDVEDKIITQHNELCSGLLDAGLERHARRARVVPKDLNWESVSDSSIRITFSLPSGSYATALLRELVMSQK